MAKQEDTIRQLRTEFENQWSDLFPSSPTPPIRALSSLRFHGDDEGNTPHGGVPFDEWMSSGAIEQLGNSLRVTEEKISQLTDQLSRKTCLRDFLLRLLECLGDSGEGRGSRPLPVNNLPTSQAVLDPTSVKKLSQQGSTNGGSTLFANEERQGSSCKRSESKPLVPRRNFSISSEKGSETRKQTTVLPRGRPSLTEGFDSGVTSKSVQGKCTLTATTASLSCGQQSTASGTAGTDDTLHQNGSATQCVVATQEKQHSGKQTCDGAVTRIDSSSRPKAALRDNTPHNHNGSEKQSDGTLYENCQGRKWRQCSSNHGSAVGTIDYSTRNQVGGETTREDHNNAVGLPIAQQGPSTAHSAKSSQSATVISVNGTQSQPTSHLFGSSANATGEHWAQTSEGSAQTDISFGVREQWVVSSTDEDRNSPSSTMFWNKKKSSGKRTQEEVRERDNSGVLGRYSDTPDLPAPPPLSATPFRSSIESGSNSPRNVQYLKLTDGFNIAFGTGETPPPLPQKQNKPRPQQQPPKNETAVEEYYETYDNNTAKRAAQKSGGAPPFVSAGSAKVSDDDKPAQVSHGSEAGRYENVSHNSGSASGIRNPVSNVTPSVSPSGTPLTPSAPPMSEEDGGHVSVSRSSSDGNSHAGSVRAAPLEASNSLKSSSKPQPHPRRKQLPPLPAKQKPSSVFYVENTTTSVSPATGGGVVVVQAAARERKRDDVDAEGRTWGRRGDGDDHHTKWEQDRREGSSSVDTEISSLQSVESGRVSSIRTGALPHAGHTRPQGDTRAERVQSNEPSLNTNSPTRVDQFVVSTSVKTRDDQEPNKAATVLQSVVEVDESTTGSTAERSSRAFPTQHTTLSARSAREEDQNEKPELAVAAGRQNIQSRTRQDRTETEGLSYHGTDPSSASDRGGRDLCGTNLIGGGEINQYSGSAASGAGSSGTTASGANASATDHDSDSANSADMLRFHRRTLSSGSAKRDAVEQSAVYRKTEDTRATPKPAFRHSAELPPGTMQPIHEDRLKGDGRGEVEATPPPTPQPDYDDHHELSSTDTGEEAHTHPKYQETDLDSDTTVSFAMLRTKNSPPAPPPKPQKKPKVNVYENWTINRAITQDFDLYEEDDSDDTSPACTLERGSTKGSKDSGLCLDVQGNHSVVADLAGDAAAAAVIAVGKDFGERVKDAARISSIEELNRMHDEEDYANVSHHHRQNCEDSPDQEDNVSIASDIMYIPGTEVTDSPRDQHRPMDHLDYGSHGNQTPSSNSDEDSPPSADVSYDDTDGKTSGSKRENMLKMRKLVVKGVLETERTYLAILELLLHYKRTLEASSRTSQPVISDEDINFIFSNLQKLQDIHKEFVDGLQNKVNNWSQEQTIGGIFKCLVVMFPEFSKYAENYQRAVATIHKCSQESQTFQELAQQIVLTSTTREVTSLEDALFKPVQRLQRNTLVLHDLIKHTPKDHPDYDTLQKALNLSQHNLENFGTNLVPGNRMEEKRNLVKSSFLVELVSGWRKLRFIFLFSDVLVCTKREQHRGGKVTFDCKWFIPMNVLKLDTKFAYQDDLKHSKKDEIDDLKKKLRSLKNELKQEMKKEESKDKHWSISGMAMSRTIEKLKKKINELEAQLILASPKLPFKVWHDTGKVHTMLMTTDYEREEWREVITSLRRKSAHVETEPPSALDVQEMVNRVRELPQVNKIGSVLTETDEEVIYGTLNVTIHKMNGLKSACDTYCCLEMDSYGHFFMKARTHICSNSLDPSWNEDFELELEGSQTLRILCYRKGPDKHGDVLLGRGALEMSKEWLKGTFQEKTVAMNDFSLVLSVRYTAAEKTMRRTPSKQSTAVFGTKISTCAKRESKTVPTIVTACVQEVEKRGMDETGIYRVSGVTSDVQKLKKYFDKNVKVGTMNVSDVDIHSVTGVLKLYFRELPEPLFTEDSYTNFVDALKLNDEEGKEKCMLSLLHNLPDINYYTAVYLLEHLLRVSRVEKDNKMSIHNLSTIFGPTLLAPATKNTAATMSEMMSLGAEQCMKQSAVIYYLLSLLVKGVSLRRSSSQL